MATYYVKNGGSDALDGLSDANAWETISKVNGSSFGAGDSILFKRGSTWRETLTIPSSGSSGNPLTFADYGAGAKPTIKASDLRNTAGTWTNEGSNLWYLSSVTVDPGILAHDGTLGFRRLTKGALVAQWNYWWDDANDRFYVYSTANPTTLATNIEVGARDNCIDPSYRHDVTVRNLDLRHSRANAFSVFWGGVNCVLDSCDLKQVSKYGVQYSNGASGAVKACAFTDWGVVDGQQYGVQVTEYDVNESGPVDVIGCTFTLTQGTNVTEVMPVMSDVGGWVRTFSRNSVIGGGFIRGSGVTIWRPGSIATTITIEENEISGTSSAGIMIQELGYNGATPTVRCRFNRLTNTCLGDALDTEALRVRMFTAACDVTVAYNIIRETYDGANAHHGIYVKGASGVKVYGNTVYGCDDGIHVGTEGGTHSTGVDVRNNICSGNRGYGLTLEASNTITGWGYNCWYDNDAGNLSGKSAGTGDVTTDPAFNDAPNGDFTLGGGSPCINAGTTLTFADSWALRPGSTWPNGVLAGNQHAYGAHWEIGAYVYGTTTSTKVMHAAVGGS